MSMAQISEVLDQHGLCVRGGFHPEMEDPLPKLDSAASTLLLIGHLGRSLSPFFEKEHEGVNPLDDWSRLIIEDLADTYNGVALFPQEGPPWLPFQKWAERCDSVFPSPMGLLIHPVYGLWHSYRAALHLPGTWSLPEIESTVSPCETCTDRPCLNTCPVDAYQERRFDARGCAGYVRTYLGQSCRTGCHARLACPVGQEYAYNERQQAFHMNAFLNGPWLV